MLFRSPLGAQWQGGFCERTCGRCTCDPRGGAPCADVEIVDLMASNGVIHTVSRILFPPPRFEKENPAPAAETVLTGSAARTREAASDADARPVLPIGVGFSVRDTEEDTVSELEASTEDEEEPTSGAARSGL